MLSISMLTLMWRINVKYILNPLSNFLGFFFVKKNPVVDNIYLIFFLYRYSTLLFNIINMIFAYYILIRTAKNCLRSISSQIPNVLFGNILMNKYNNICEYIIESPNNLLLVTTWHILNKFQGTKTFRIKEQ